MDYMLYITKHAMMRLTSDCDLQKLIVSHERVRILQLQD